MVKVGDCEFCIRKFAVLKVRYFGVRSMGDLRNVIMHGDVHVRKK